MSSLFSRMSAMISGRGPKRYADKSKINEEFFQLEVLRGGDPHRPSAVRRPSSTR